MTSRVGLQRADTQHQTSSSTACSVLLLTPTNMRLPTARGILTGILYYYPADIPPPEKAGNVNIFVDPAY
jgi:hypothetical protein